jgi:uncharacterized protein YjbI with pentapeptide repeats/formylglycine-generating enzyme required for sulfatase activity
MNRITFGLTGFCALLFFAPFPATAVTIETVLVGNAGNVPDQDYGDGQFGRVDYAYRIGRYEVTNGQYAEFLNAKAASDPLALYNTDMGSDPRGGITRGGSSGTFSYSSKADMGNKPVNYVSFYDALRFANWLHNGMGAGSTENGAYTLLGGTAAPSNGLVVSRSAGARWFLPSENEWYKAAYHQPLADGGDSDDYWFYPGGTNSVPAQATANSVGDISNPGTNVANFASGADWNGQVGNVTTVGSAGPWSESFYGTSDQGGNVWEWNEQLFTGFGERGLRGGSWTDASFTLFAPNRNYSAHSDGNIAGYEFSDLGFRVASVPEPGSLALLALALPLIVSLRRQSSPYHKVFATGALAGLLSMLAPPQVTRADIFQWEFINPANPGLGKQQSTTLAPDGAGVNAVPAANLSSRNLTMAYLIGTNLVGASAQWGANLTDADVSQANLTNTNFSGYLDLSDDGGFYPGADLTNANLNLANISGANFTYAILTGASLANAEVRGANFHRDSFGGSGIALAQLYSTASYHARDLAGIVLSGNNLTGANLSGQNLTNADFSGVVIYGSSGEAFLPGANLTDANLSQTNLSGANFIYATLTGASLANAEVRGAKFQYAPGGSGIKPAQLYSTASYQAHDVSGINLSGNELPGANFSGQNLTFSNLASSLLTNANFSQANLANTSLRYASLAGANFTEAGVRRTDFTNYGGNGIKAAQLYTSASYQAHDLTGISLAGNNFAAADLTEQNLVFANFADANLNGANFTAAIVNGADFSRAGFTQAQIYSTASYQAHDMNGITLVNTNLAGADLSSQNLAGGTFRFATLTNANLSNANLNGARFSQDSSNFDSEAASSADLNGANLTHADLSNADFSGWEYRGSESYIYSGANLTSANLTGADARSANFQYAILNHAILSGADTRGANFENASMTFVNTENLIRSNGHITGLDLTIGKALTIRNFHIAVAPKVVIDQQLSMDSSGTLRLVFDADHWDSIISFAPGIPVARGGTLDLTFAAGVDVAAQSGRTIDLFNWIGVSPTGTFVVSSPYSWDLTKLNTTGEITLLPTADFNGDNHVDAADLAAWTSGFGLAGPAADNQGDADFDHDVDGNDFLAWQRQLGSGLPAVAAEAAVPEPTTLLICVTTLAGIRPRYCRRRQEFLSA